ncbi:colicin E5-related ribonuclease [Chitinophaga sp. LS1]|uniref:colicin E5-related ribonuclease n=1 Tax=Chitinophaga sp. LS1 TaxID=3051176 RepID=UPI002AAAE63E|nr:colicin E5-related ribonuclease [Chitinophaga sp. LS1]WPV64848.1 colicin E5-related ribonuclease [Chitinophaga sp. LS1]
MATDTGGNVNLVPLYGNKHYDSTTRPLPPRKPFLKVHGNVMYDYYYQSGVDTPYQQKNIYQHTVQTSLDLTISDQYPIRVNFTTARGNSTLFRNITGILNGATAVNKYAELKAFAESGRATSVYGIIDKKIADQMLYRKWTGELIDETILHPYTTRVSTNKATGVESTVFYQENGSYVIRENNTNKIIQISDRTVPDWIPDDNIINPYIPKK